MPSLCLRAGFSPLGVELAARARIRKYSLHLLWKSVGSESRAQFSAEREWGRRRLKRQRERFWYYGHGRSVGMMQFSLLQNQNNQDRGETLQRDLVWDAVDWDLGISHSEVTRMWQRAQDAQVSSERACWVPGAAWPSQRVVQPRLLGLCRFTSPGWCEAKGWEDRKRGSPAFRVGASVKILSTSAPVQPCSGKSSGVGMDFGGFWALSGGLCGVGLLFA